LISEDQIAVLTTISEKADLSRAICDIQGLFEHTIDSHHIVIMAHSRCKGGSTFLQSWSETLDAAQLACSVIQQFEHEASPSKRLPLLFIAYVIHFHVHFPAREEATNEDPRLPNGLGQPGYPLLWKALLAHARKFGQEDTLKALVPLSDLPFNLTEHEVKMWNDLWAQTFPQHWLKYSPTPATMDYTSEQNPVLKLPSPKQPFLDKWFTACLSRLGKAW
jgi:hypothetical protein